MKKLMTLAVLLVMALTASAKGGDLNLVDGSLTALKDAGKTVIVAFDYKGALMTLIGLIVTLVLVWVLLMIVNVNPWSYIAL